MGLDMYLYGNKFVNDFKGPEVTEDGYVVEKTILNLGYWRKDWGLHGFIVTNFADGNDNCQEVELSRNNIDDIIKALKEKAIDREADDIRIEDPSFDLRSVEIFEKALQWMGRDPGERYITYRASW